MAIEAGRVLNQRYRLIRPVGQGSQASVWVAEHLALTTHVAVKLIDPELAKKESARERFRREATAAAQLRSAHVVQILDHGIDGDQPFIVMELLDGEDLFERLAHRTRLSLRETSKIVTQVARALSRAHAAGIVHRDLKPENVFLCPNDDDEVVKVLDFGVAKVKDAAKVTMQKTGVGTLIGTPHYMSPEQVKGIGEIDYHTDLWALGVIAFQCVTGELPYDSEGVGDLLIKITIGEEPIPSKVYPGISPNFDAWFAKACAREPAKRFQSAREMALALAGVVGVVDGVAPRAPTARPPAHSSPKDLEAIPKAPRAATAQLDIGEWEEVDPFDEDEAPARPRAPTAPPPSSSSRPAVPRPSSLGKDAGLTSRPPRPTPKVGVPSITSKPTPTSTSTPAPSASKPTPTSTPAPSASKPTSTATPLPAASSPISAPAASTPIPKQPVAAPPSPIAAPTASTPAASKPASAATAAPRPTIRSATSKPEVAGPKPEVAAPKPEVAAPKLEVAAPVEAAIAADKTSASATTNAKPSAEPITQAPPVEAPAAAAPEPAGEVAPAAAPPIEAPLAAAAPAAAPVEEGEDHDAHEVDFDEGAPVNLRDSIALPLVVRANPNGSPNAPPVLAPLSEPPRSTSASDEAAGPELAGQAVPQPAPSAPATNADVAPAPIAAAPSEAIDPPPRSIPRAPRPPPPPPPSPPMQIAPSRVTPLEGPVSSGVLLQDAPPELDGSKRRRMVRYMVAGLVIFAVGITWTVVRSQFDASSGAAPPPPTSTTTAAPPPSPPPTEVAPAVTAAPTAAAVDPGKVSHPTKPAPSSHKATPSRGPRRLQPNDGTIDIPEPDEP